MTQRIWTLATLSIACFVLYGGCGSMEQSGGCQPAGPLDQQPGDSDEVIYIPSTDVDGPDFPEEPEPPMPCPNGEDCEEPTQHDLNGLWLDFNGRATRIHHEGDQVIASYVEPYECDHQDGTGQISETNHNFDAVISGDILTGQTSVCRSGDCYDDDRIPPFLGAKTLQANGDGGSCVRGLLLADMTLQVNEDNTELSGAWFNILTESDVDFGLSRVLCVERSAQEFGLSEGNVVTSEYNALRVYRKDGTIQTVPEDYVLNPETDDFLRYHRGIDYSSNNQDGLSLHQPFAAGVSGTVEVLEGSQWNTINVHLPNGNVVQYLHASVIYVMTGDQVTSTTLLGETGNAGLGPGGAIHLHVQARDAEGNYIDPNCAEVDNAQ